MHFCFRRFPAKKYSNRLADKQKLAMQKHSKLTVKISEKEQIANAVFEREMTPIERRIDVENDQTET